MLEAIFSEGILTVTVTGLTQWDYGRKLTIKGLSYTDSVEVHFSNNIEKLAIVMEATKSGSDLVTEVPNVLLEKNSDITAWVYIDSGTSGETVRTIILKVKPRIKPADYISENNAKEIIDYVDEAKELLENATEQADRLDEIVDRVPDFDSYEKLAEHDHLLYDGLYVQGETYSGVASNKGIKLHSVKGKTSQKTTNGYQLFDSSKLATKTQGGATVTNNNDGSFTVSGSGTLSERFVSSDLYIDMPFTLKEGKLCLKTENIVYPSVYIDFAGDEGFIVSISIRSGNDSAEIELTSEQASKIKKYKPIFVGNANEPIRTGTVKPMLYQDGDGTFEEFTGGKPAPNPDYAMPIENVEISKLVSYGKNIISSIPKGGMVYARCTYEYIDVTKELTIKATANDAYIGEVSSLGNTYKTTNGTLYLIPKNAIKVYFRSEKGIFNSVYATFYDENKKSLGYAKVGSYSIPEGAKYVSFRIGVNPSTNETSYTDKLYASFEELEEDYIEPNYEEVETSLTLAQDDIYQQGTITRARKQVTFDGSSDEGWSFEQTTSRPTINVLQKLIKRPTNNQYAVNMKCNRIKVVSANDTYLKTEGISVDTDGRLQVYLSAITSLDTWKTWLQSHPLVVEYELATPTTEEYQVPTIPSYYPFTKISTDNDLTTDITWKILADCDNSLKQEELEKRIEALEKQMIGG